MRACIDCAYFAGLDKRCMHHSLKVCEEYFDACSYFEPRSKNLGEIFCLGDFWESSFSMVDRFKDHNDLLELYQRRLQAYVRNADESVLGLKHFVAAGNWVLVGDTMLDLEAYARGLRSFAFMIGNAVERCRESLLVEKHGPDVPRLGGSIVGKEGGMWA